MILLLGLFVGAVIWLVVAEMCYPNGQWQAYREEQRKWAAFNLFMERHGEALFFPFGRQEHHP